MYAKLLLTLAVCCLWLPPASAQAPKKAVPAEAKAGIPWDKIADGAVVVATMKYNAGGQNPVAEQLLKFALKVNPEHAKGLVLQGKVERGLELEKIELADGGDAYVGMLLKAITAAKGDNQRLMLLKVVELVKPDQETALLELTKAKNKGVDTSFEGLLDAFSTTVAAKVKAPAGDDGKPATAAVAPGAGRPADAGAKTDSTDLEKKLRELTVAEFEFSASYLPDNLNRLSGILSASAIQVDVATAKVQLRKYYDNETGAPHFWQNSDGPAVMHRAMASGWGQQPPLKDISGLDLVKKICRQFGLGYKLDGQKVVFIDADDAAAVKTLGVSLDAQQLARQFKSEGIKSVQKYQTQRIEIKGDVDGLGKSGRFDFIDLAGSKVRVFFTEKASGGKDFDKLRDEIKAMKEGGRKAKKGQTYTYSTTGGVTYTPKFTLTFYGSCKYAGTEMDRVELKDCDSFSWSRNYIEEDGVHEHHQRE